MSPIPACRAQRLRLIRGGGPPGDKWQARRNGGGRQPL